MFFLTCDAPSSLASGLTIVYGIVDMSASFSDPSLLMARKEFVSARLAVDCKSAILLMFDVIFFMCATASPKFSSCFGHVPWLLALIADWTT